MDAHAQSPRNRKKENLSKENRLKTDSESDEKGLSVSSVHAVTIVKRVFFSTFLGFRLDFILKTEYII